MSSKRYDTAFNDASGSLGLIPIINSHRKKSKNMAEFNNQSIQNDSLLSNVTQEITEIYTEESLEFKYIKVTFYFLILFCATFGNSMVIYVICTSKRMKSSSHLLILNLAICDLFTPLVSIPFDFALEENGYVWMYGYFMCKVLSPAATFSTTASSLTLAAISLDRYRLLMHPFKRKLSSNQIKGIIIGVYIFSALAVSPYTYGLKLENDSCQEQWSGKLYRQLYTLALFLFQYAIPLIFMTIMYTLAIINLHSTSGKVRHCSINSSSRPSDSTGGPKALKGLSKIKMSLKRKLSPADENPNIRAMKMFMAVVTVFAIFMFPNQVLWIWADYGDGASQPHFSQIAIICWLFTYTNSVVNPVIFAIFSKDFRVGFKGVFRLIFCCNSKALPERCLSCEGQTKTDSSTNEMLSEKKTICEIPTYHSNIHEKDTSSIRTKNPSYEDVSVFDKTVELNDNLDVANLKSKPYNEAPRIKNHELPPAYSDLTEHIESTHGLTKALMDFSSSEDLNENELLPKLEDVECNDELIDSQSIGSKMEDSVIPVLHPNAVAILEDLPETDC